MGDCIFCKIISGEIPSDKVFENENVLAFKDINPQAPVHIIVIPKEHKDNILEIDPSLMENLHAAIKNIVSNQGLAKRGFRLAANTGEEGGQLVQHFHWHIMGGRQMDGKLG